MTLFDKRLGRAESLSLLLIVAFPVHVWAILIGLRNFQAVAERAANLVDGVAYLSYALLSALMESLLIFGFLYLLNFLLPRNYSAGKRVVQLGWLGVAISAWLILRQLFDLIVVGNPIGIANFVMATGRPYVITMLGLGLLLGLILLSVAGPLLLVHRRPRFEQRLAALFERLAPLSGLYLALDAIGVAIVLGRNLL